MDLFLRDYLFVQGVYYMTGLLRNLQYKIYSVLIRNVIQQHSPALLTETLMKLIQLCSGNNEEMADRRPRSCEPHYIIANE